MPLSYHGLRHKTTGNVCHIPAGRYGNFLNSIKKLVSYILTIPAIHGKNSFKSEIPAEPDRLQGRDGRRLC